MDIDPQTFCAAPWFQVRTDHSGTYRVCNSINPSRSHCSSQAMAWPQNTPNDFLHSDYVRYLREQLTKGNRLPECDLCWRNEACGGVSQRQIVNDTVTKNRGHEISNTWLTSYFRRKADYDTNLLLSADIKLSNICNYHCVMCGPDDSSRIQASWQRDHRHPVIKMMLEGQENLLDQVRQRYGDRDQNLIMLREVLEHPIKNLKLLGGEPLLDQAVLDLLAGLPEHKKSAIALSFVTNGSVNLNKVAAQLRGFRDVHFAVSLDGTRAIQDFIRRGSSWDYISDNIESWQTDHPTQRLNVICTIQALNLLHLFDLIDWCQQRGIDLHFGHVSDPVFLSLSTVPESLRDRALQQLGGAVEFDFDQLLREFPHRPDLLPRLGQYMQWYDPNWLSVLPEWQSHIRT